MYGIEAASGGLGGLGAQAPGGDVYLARTLGINPTASVLAGAGRTSGQYLGSQTRAPMVSPTGSAVEHPASHIIPGTLASLVDFHNSPMPYILIAAMLLYGWLHVSLRAGPRGRLATIGLGA